MKRVPDELPQRPLGRTGRSVSILGLGGDHLVTAGQKEAIRIVRDAADRGITFFDNAWEYGEGRAERWMGMAIKEGGFRDRITLMTKCCAHQRDYKTAMQQLEESLTRLKTDCIDLWQFHEIIYENDIDWLYEHGGLDAALEARDQGKIRWIGFSGHKSTHVHLRMLHRDFPWDAVQMPLNPFDATFRSFERLVLPELVQRGIGVIAMKSMCGGALARSRLIKPDEALRYCFSLPVSTVVSGMESTALLRKNTKVASSFRTFHAGEMDALRQRAKVVAGDGRLERYKTTQDFDGRLGREAHGFSSPEPDSRGRRMT